MSFCKNDNRFENIERKTFVAAIFRVPVAVARSFCHAGVWARCFIVYFFMRHNRYGQHGRRTPVLLLLLLYTVGDGNLFCLRRLDSAKRVQNCYLPDTAAVSYFTLKLSVLVLRPVRRHVFRVVVTARIYTRQVGLFIHYLFFPSSSIANSVGNVVLGPFCFLCRNHHRVFCAFSA